MGKGKNAYSPDKYAYHEFRLCYFPGCTDEYKLLKTEYFLDYNLDAVTVMWNKYYKTEKEALDDIDNQIKALVDNGWKEVLRKWDDTFDITGVEGSKILFIRVVKPLFSQKWETDPCLASSQFTTSFIDGKRGL